MSSFAVVVAPGHEHQLELAVSLSRVLSAAGHRVALSAPTRVAPQGLSIGGVQIRPTEWRVCDGAERSAVLKLVGRESQDPSVDPFLLPDDSFAGLLDVDCWIVVGELSGLSIVPLKPYYVVCTGEIWTVRDKELQRVHEYLQRADRIIIESESSSRRLRTFIGNGRRLIGITPLDVSIAGPSEPPGSIPGERELLVWLTAGTSAVLRQHVERDVLGWVQGRPDIRRVHLMSDAREAPMDRLFLDRLGEYSPGSLMPTDGLTTEAIVNRARHAHLMLATGNSRLASSVSVNSTEFCARVRVAAVGHAADLLGIPGSHEWRRRSDMTDYDGRVSRTPSAGEVGISDAVSEPS